MTITIRGATKISAINSNEVILSNIKHKPINISSDVTYFNSKFINTNIKPTNLNNYVFDKNGLVGNKIIRLYHINALKKIINKTNDKKLKNPFTRRNMKNIYIIGGCNTINSDNISKYYKTSNYYNVVRNPDINKNYKNCIHKSALLLIALKKIQEKYKLENKNINSSVLNTVSTLVNNLTDALEKLVDNFGYGDPLVKFYTRDYLLYHKMFIAMVTVETIKDSYNILMENKNHKNTLPSSRRRYENKLKLYKKNMESLYKMLYVSPKSNNNNNNEGRNYIEPKVYGKFKKTLIRFFQNQREKLKYI